MEFNFEILEGNNYKNNIAYNYQICNQAFSNRPDFRKFDNARAFETNLYSKGVPYISRKRNRDNSNSSNNKSSFLFNGNIFSKFFKNSNDNKSSDLNIILEQPIKKESSLINKIIIYPEIFKIEKEPINKNDIHKVQKKDINFINDNKDISNYNNDIYKEKYNDNILFKFNYYYFRKHYYTKYEECIFNEPHFISMKKIIKKYQKYINELWNGDKKIYNNKYELIYIHKNSKNYIIYKNILEFLKNKKGGTKKEKLKRGLDPDEMLTKIKTYILQKIITFINTFEDLKNSPIETIQKNLINNKIKSDFNLIYLKQHLYSILSNDSSSICKYSNCDKIKKILFSCNKEKEKEFLNLTIQDCLDIFRYKCKDKKIEINLNAFLIQEYNNFLVKDNKSNSEKIKLKKDYIASLLLIIYNFERAFFLKLKRGFRGDKKLLGLLIKYTYFKIFINKISLLNKKH